MHHLFYEHPYRRTHSTRVTSCEQHNAVWHVSLEETIFYPEGGGQPGDRGTINDVRVFDTLYDVSGDIVHICEAPVSDDALCTLDWEWRYFYMGAHTAQHLISACLAQLSYPTVSVHLGNDAVYVDIDAKHLSEKDIAHVEQQAFACIRQNLPVVSRSVDSVDQLALRRPLSQKAISRIHMQDIRIVEIGNGDIDRVACAGVHVNSCSELGYILYLSEQTMHERLRTMWLVAEQARSHIRLMQHSTQEIKHILSEPLQSLAKRAQTIQKNLKEQNLVIRSLQQKITSIKCTAATSGLLKVEKDELYVIKEIIPMLLKKTDQQKVFGAYYVHESHSHASETVVDWIFVHPPAAVLNHPLCISSKDNNTKRNNSKMVRGTNTLSEFSFFLKDCYDSIREPPIADDL